MRAPHRGRGFGTLRDQRWRSAHRPFDDASPHSTTHLTPFHTAKRPLQIAPRDRAGRRWRGIDLVARVITSSRGFGPSSKGRAESFVRRKERPGGDLLVQTGQCRLYSPSSLQASYNLRRFCSSHLRQPALVIGPHRRSLQALCTHTEACARVPGNYGTAYEAAASSAGAPMMLRNLSSSRESNRETCIWLMPSSWAISDCERCSK